MANLIKGTKIIPDAQIDLPIITDKITWEKTLLPNNILMDLQQGFGIFSDNVSYTGGAGKRLWISSAIDGDIIIGPRTGVPTNTIMLNAANFFLSDQVNALTLTTGTSGLVIDSGAGAKQVWDDGNTANKIAYDKLKMTITTSGALITPSDTVQTFNTGLSKANTKILSVFFDSVSDTVIIKSVSHIVYDNGGTWYIACRNNHATTTVTLTINVLSISAT